MAGNKPVNIAAAVRRQSDRKIVGAIAFNGPKKGWDRIKKSVDAQGWFIDYRYKPKKQKKASQILAPERNTDG